MVNVANRTLTVTNGLLRNGDVSCTITAKVTSTSAVTYTNGKPNGNFSNVKGIDGPPNAEVAFWSGSVSWSKVDDQTPSNLLAGSVWTLSGPSPATTSAPAGGWPVGEVTDCTAWPCTGLLDQNPATGQFKVTGLPAGTYTLTEKTAPQGYELITGSFTATVSDASRDVVFTGTGVADGKIKNTRKLGMAAWEKIDDQTPAANLGGSEWTVQGPYTGSTPSGTTTSVVDCVGANQPSQAACNVDKDSAAGKFRLENLAWGSYTVTETKAPAGHQLTNPAQSFTFTVDAANAGTVINGGKVVNRRIPGEVTWAKVETGTTTKLSGSEWKLEGPGGFNDGNPLEIADCAGSTCDGPDKDPVGGAFKLVGLPWGSYTLTETKAPAGYVRSSAPITFTIGIDSPAKLVWNHGDIENDRREGPAIPFTGGLGRDAFFIAGGAALLLGLGAVGVSGARRRRAR